MQIKIVSDMNSLVPNAGLKSMCWVTWSAQPIWCKPKITRYIEVIMEWDPPYIKDEADTKYS